MIQPASLALPLVALLLSCFCLLFSAAEAPKSYLDAFGQHSVLADKLAELVGAEEPLLPADLARLTSEVRRACKSGSAGSSVPTYRLTAADLAVAYGKGEGRVLDQRAVEQACAAIMACQLDESCSLSDGPLAAGGLHETINTPVTSMLRLGAALALFLEGLAGVYIPVLLKSFQGYEWWLSLLNCFSGGVFLAAGLVHLLPHCAEAQQRLGPLVGDYPLYLVLITLGYMLVLFVERVLFDVHGSAHGHGPHTGIAPPCVDCRTAEGMLVSSSGDPAGISNHSMHSADDADRQQQQQQQAASAAGGVDGANGQLTPGQGRYNLRSRTHGTPQQGNSANGAAEDLVKPLLTDAAGAAREQHVDEHGGHMHAHADGCSAGHSVSLQQQHAHAHLAHTHHHAVVVAGDLRQGMVLLVAMAVHTFLECMALGLMDQRKEFLMLFMAIASHKLISGLALSSRFLKDGATTRQITLYVGPFVIVAPTAILAGMYVSNVHPLVHLALSCFATGTFLYVGASEIVEEEFEGDMRSGRTDITQVFARWVKFLMLLLGVAAIALLSMIPDAHDHGSGGLGHGSHTHGLGAGGHHHHQHH